MTFEWFIAKRYFQAHSRRGFLSFITTFAVIGIMLGTAALIMALSILDGFEREIKEKVVGFTSHIEVQGFRNLWLSDYRKSLERLKNEVKGINSASPFVAREAMIRSRESVDGIFLKGIDPSIDVSTTRQHLVHGRFLSDQPADVQEMVIGKKLAIKLNVDVGDKLVVFGLPRSEGDNMKPRAMQFHLVGIYETGMAEYDDIYAYTNLSSAQKLFQAGDIVSGYDILVKDIATVDRVASDCQELLGYPHYARTVFQTYRNLFSWVELQKKLSPLLLTLIIIVATINTIGTLLMYVLEKTQAIGILKSLGASPKSIRRIFILQGAAMAGAGIVLGNILGFILSWLQLTFRIISLPSEIYYMNTVPISLSIGNFAVVTIVTFFLCVLTTLLPSRAAARLHPVVALRFG